MNITTPSLIVTLILASFPLFGQTAQSPATPKSNGYSESAISKPDFSDVRSAAKDKKKKKETTKEQAGESSDPHHKVRLPFSVFDASWKFVEGITSEDVEIFVDGQKSELTKLEASNSAAEVLLLIDVSPSILYEIKSVQTFLVQIVSALRPTDRVSIIKFAASTKVLIDSSVDRAAINKAIKKIDFDGGTSLYDAVDEVSRKLAGELSALPKAIVLVSDGVDTTSRKSGALESLSNVVGTNSVFFPVYIDTFQNSLNAQSKVPRVVANLPGVGPILNAPPQVIKEDYEQGKIYLNHLLSITGGRAFKFPISETEMPAVASTIAQEIRSRYTATVDLGKLATSGEKRQVRVRIKKPGLTIRSRSFILQ